MPKNTVIYSRLALLNSQGLSNNRIIGIIASENNFTLNYARNFVYSWRKDNNLPSNEKRGRKKKEPLPAPHQANTVPTSYQPSSLATAHFPDSYTPKPTHTVVKEKKKKVDTSMDTCLLAILPIDSIAIAEAELQRIGCSKQQIKLRLYMWGKIKETRKKSLECPSKNVDSSVPLKI